MAVTKGNGLPFPAHPARLCHATRHARRFIPIPRSIPPRVAHSPPYYPLLSSRAEQRAFSSVHVVNARCAVEGSLFVFGSTDFNLCPFLITNP